MLKTGEKSLCRLEMSKIKEEAKSWQQKYITLALAQREMHIALIKMEIALMVKDG